MTETLVKSRLEKRFEKWDLDGNGVLERSDFEGEAGKIASAFGKSPNSPEAESLKNAFTGLYDYLAGQGQGSLTRQQFVDVSGQVLFQSGEATFNRVLGPVVRGIIGLCDESGDGRIDGKEFAAWMKGVGVGQAEAAEAFRKVDTDGDGTLTEEELLAAIREYHFGRLEVELLG
ncbi:EF-hand domain-containing protein [Streptomyces sp. SW4]|nr:EF-hand domain-containing protein [Streptomyces sp. SW4]